MDQIKTSLLIAFTLGLLSPGVARARDWPNLAVPPHSRIEAVASDMTFNGLPMRVRQFHTEQKPTDVLKFYKRQWNGHYVLNRLGPWQVLGRKRGGYYESIQIKPDGSGAQGLIGITALTDISNDAKPGNGFARMQDTRVINDIVSHDLGKTGRTLILMNRFSISSNALFYRQRMKDGGWHEAKTGSARPRLQGRSGTVLKFNRGSENAVIIIGRKDGRTSIVANLVRQGR